MRRYNPKEIEPKWQKIWEESGIYKATEDKTRPKRYVLEYFPYPSGAAMHVGHVRNYTIGDVVARHGRMSGMNILHPMGWDAFGLPAENYAIKTGISPQEAVAKNVDTFKQQLMQMGFSYDWTREINSTDPDYYKWTQWFFIFLYNKGLAYQAESLQWWCPFDKTVLANEQVENGRCWRCGHEVEKKALKQWFFKIREYADRLEKDLDKIDWSESIKSIQRNWIGKSGGAEIDFKVDGHDEKIKVFTTRPDTIFGTTFLVLAPEHKILNKLSIPEKAKVNEYIKEAERKSEIERQETEREKTGVFTGLYAINPANKEKIPIWVADYVLPSYGTGAIMAVPAHDDRDYEFAKKFNLPIRQAIMHCADDSTNPPKAEYKEVERETVIVHLLDKSSGKFALLDWHESLEGITTAIMGGIESGQTPEQAALNEIKEEAALKDVKIISKMPWITSARYCASHKQENRKAVSHVFLAEVDNLDNQGKIDSSEQKTHTLVWVDKNEVLERLVPDNQKLVWSQLWDPKPLDTEGELINSGKYDGLSSSEAREKITKEIGKERVNYKIRDWLISRQRYWGAPIPMIHCPKDGIVPVPEKDLPVVLPKVKSYEPSGDGRSPLANVPEFVDVKCPKCGGDAQRETDTMDGFACSSWYFLRFADPHNDKEPFAKQKAEFWLPVDDYIGGAEHAVMHLLYARFWTKVMHDGGLINFDEPFLSLRNQGMILAPDGQKMSKSKGNTIEPDELISHGYGADSIRLMELFIGPWNQAVNWSIEGIGGTFRFLQRYWTLAQEFLEADHGDNPRDLEITAQVHKTIKKVSEDLHGMEFNTAIAAMMSLVNDLYKIKAEEELTHSAGWRFAMETLTQLLAPFAPHIAEEVWESLGHESSVHISRWPKWDENLVAEEFITIAIQVNGKVRSEVVVNTDISEEDAIAAAKTDEKVAPLIKGKPIKKEIYVPGRLVSLVI
jgi:leucyl-tRNA synthetase